MIDLKKLFEGLNPTPEKYPFEEGDSYFIIENGRIVALTWNEESKLLHFVNPRKEYFKTPDEALLRLLTD